VERVIARREGRTPDRDGASGAREHGTDAQKPSQSSADDGLQTAKDGDEAVETERS